MLEMYMQGQTLLAVLHDSERVAPLPADVAAGC
jgi:hypothetical protein